jgi:hypothetical protein
MGIHGYGKRFAPNWLEVENCFPTAVGRILFSRSASDDSTYLYMSETEAARYEQSTASKIARNEGLQQPVRVRANGPHTKFRVHFTRGIQKMVSRGHRMHHHPSFITPHGRKRTSYKQLKRLHRVSQQDINDRAGECLATCAVLPYIFLQITILETLTHMVPKQSRET